MTLKYYCLGPEVSGDFGANTVQGDVRERPPKVTKFDYELHTWPNDDFLEALDTYIGTHRLAEKIQSLRLTGITFDEVEISTSPEFEEWRELHKDEELPDYLWFKINGRPGVDDFGMLADTSELFPLVVSEKALEVLRSVKSEHLRVKEYDAQKATRP